MDTIKLIWSWLGDLSLFIWLVGAVVIMGGSLMYFWRFLSAQWRFGKNLRRKVYFLKTSDVKNLQTQKDKVKALKLFNVEDDIKDISQQLVVLQTLKDNAVYIVGYDKDYDYSELIETAKANNIPIIIFAAAGEIRDWSLFNSYIYCDVANTTNRVAIILLNIMHVV